MRGVMPVTAARVQLISPDRLSDDLIDLWRSHQLANENLRGPFFSPEYIRLTALFPEERRLALRRYQ